jgi:glycolate oxidase FAD binding subunit
VAVGLQRQAPGTAQGAADVLHEAARRGDRVRIVGAGTKPWGRRGEPPDLELATAGLDHVVEHNEGDFTVVAQAGLRVAALQERLAAAGQMLALDPPDDGATLGGLVAAGDSGPLRHRFNAPRDLVIGVQVALPDGTVARAGGRVIKNVAGYDLGKLLCGSFGTLGLISEVSLRLHPRPAATATVAGGGDDVHALAGAAATLAHRSLEPDALDVQLDGEGGAVLARFSGATAAEQAQRAAPLLREAGLEERVEAQDDDALWMAQRAGQRSADGTVVRVSSVQARLGEVLEAARAAGATVVGRAALGLSWLRLEGLGDEEAVRRVCALRARLAPAPCVVLDAPDGVRDALDPWDGPTGAELALMRSVKARFDPQGTCNAGRFVGGL